MKRALVTGAAGFIGSALVRRLLADGIAVLSFDALTYAGRRAWLEGLDGDHTFRHADIRDAAAVSEALDEFRPDTLFHLAAESHVDRSISGPAAFLDTNVTGTLTLLEAVRARGNEITFVHVSTDEVFGDLAPDARPSLGSAPYAPSSPYAASKAASDHLARAWRRTYDTPTIVTNCTNNYGPRQYPEKLIPATIARALAGQPLAIYGAGDQIRDWLHVEDHANALATIGSQGALGETYLIGARAERRNIDVVQQLCAILDRLRPGAKPYANLIEHVTDRPGHDKRYALDPSHLEDALGWRPRHSFEDGLEATVRWYLDHPEALST
ncbi:dTDP-glucose 4,6-dehydratase [Pontivivens ytuae]|uniref:dTDP-glucose 4,6-dehydratase n=1 Tax=Pontivivens ytuae TaxID=2789856 RepID=A0A7S9LVI3_9RHOB|nr:dTDP-glucose 4,6-dehydratase [Pontivivens ytuae]QPH55946.1 dTDP-glucose 4,6-dehydratase [Pontivivens ytuae]